MKINIRAIPHKSQRYDTCGDYWKGDDGATEFRVSSELPELEQLCVVIHELVEQSLCARDGVSNDDIDAFDRQFEEKRQQVIAGKRLADEFIHETAEPGDHPNAPYRMQHQKATAVERVVALALGLDWADYENDVMGLDYYPE